MSIIIGVMMSAGGQTLASVSIEHSNGGALRTYSVTREVVTLAASLIYQQVLFDTADCSVQKWAPKSGYAVRRYTREGSPDIVAKVDPNGWAFGLFEGPGALVECDKQAKECGFTPFTEWRDAV